jgi:acetyl-CoA carboxylase carboxyl transferase subunit beta
VSTPPVHDTASVAADRRAEPASALLFNDFISFGVAPESSDPLRWPEYQARLIAARRRSGQRQAVAAGTASVNGHLCVAVDFDFNFLGGSMGQAEGELVVHAIEHAAQRQLPLVSVTRSGGARMQEGTVALVQMARIARALVNLAEWGVPHIAVADDPTTGGVWASLVAAADVIIARRGAQIAFAGARVRSDLAVEHSPAIAEVKYEAGFIDEVVDNDRLAEAVGNYLGLLSPLTRGATAEPPVPTSRAPRHSSELTGWDSVLAARNPQRQRSAQYLADYFESTAALSGDRVGGRDAQMQCGLGRRDGRTIAFLFQRGGQIGAAGFRTASRVLALAERLHVPAVTFIDTQGADNGAESERQGVGTAIAELLQQIARCTVPVLSIVVGQGVSGGAIALINPDNLWMAPDSYLAVIAPESAAAILKQDPGTVPQVADQLMLSPHQLHGLGLSRGVVP